MEEMCKRKVQHKIKTKHKSRFQHLFRVTTITNSGQLGWYITGKRFQFCKVLQISTDLEGLVPI